MDILAPRAYSILAHTESGWQRILGETTNRQRRRVHVFDTVRTDRVRLVIEARSHATDVPLTPICEIRLYDDGARH